MVEAAELQAIALFRHLSMARLKPLAEVAEASRYEKGAVLFRQGDAARAVWTVLEGWVHLVRSADGAVARPVVIFTITPEEVLCGLSATVDGAYQVTAVAGTSCRVVRFPAERFNAALAQEARFAYDTLRLCVRRLQHIAQQYGSMAEPVSHRLIRSMLRLRQQFGTTLPITHRELAQMSWTTTESAIRLVRRLKQEGYVRGARGRLTISKAGELERLLKPARGDGHA